MVNLSRGKIKGNDCILFKTSQHLLKGTEDNHEDMGTVLITILLRSTRIIAGQLLNRRKFIRLILVQYGVPDLII
jgi:hypothetical protein